MLLGERKEATQWIASAPRQSSRGDEGGGLKELTIGREALVEGDMKETAFFFRSICSMEWKSADGVQLQMNINILRQRSLLPRTRSFHERTN